VSGPPRSHHLGEFPVQDRLRQGMRHPVVPLSDVPLTEEAHDAAVGLARQARRLSPPLFVDGVQEVPQRCRKPDRSGFFASLAAARNTSGGANAPARLMPRSWVV